MKEPKYCGVCHKIIFPGRPHDECFGKSERPFPSAGETGYKPMSGLTEEETKEFRQLGDTTLNAISQYGIDRYRSLLQKHLDAWEGL